MSVGATYPTRSLGRSQLGASALLSETLKSSSSHLGEALGSVPFAAGSALRGSRLLRNSSQSDAFSSLPYGDVAYGFEVPTVLRTPDLTVEAERLRLRLEAAKAEVAKQQLRAEAAAAARAQVASTASEASSRLLEQLQDDQNALDMLIAAAQGLEENQEDEDDPLMGAALKAAARRHSSSG